MSEPLVAVENLTIRFKTDEGVVTAVDDVTYNIAPGEILGLVGESGSGKSVTAKALMQLNAKNTVYDPASKIAVNVPGETPIDVFSITSERDMKPIRGGFVSMIFQEPMASFAPAITVGDQMVEQLLLHTDMTKKQARSHSVEMLDRVLPIDGMGRAITTYGQRIARLDQRRGSASPSQDAATQNDARFRKVVELLHEETGTDLLIWFRFIKAIKY